MKKLLLLLLFIPLVASSRMFPTQFEVKSVCFDNADEAIKYHQDVLGEYPIGKGWVSEHSFGAIMYNPVNPSWTFLSFHTSEDGVIVCAVTGGTQWDILTPGEDKIQL